MRKIHQGLSYVLFRSIAFFVALGLLITPGFVGIVDAAPTPEQLKSIVNDTTFYDPAFTTSCTSTNIDYVGKLDEAQLNAIEANKPFYQAAADQVDIPWELIASIHGRETGFRRYGPANGYGPYQITPSNYPIKEPYTDTEFQDATNNAAASIKRLVGDRDLSDVNNIKYVMFAYNGAADVYINQAKSLGFSDEEAARGEGSPYVMNGFDLQRDPTVEPTKSNATWGQIKVDYGDIEYPANSDYGAFIYYAAIKGGSNDCNTNADALNGDANAIQSEFTAYMNSHNERYADKILGVNGCTTLAAWFIGEHTTLTYGRGDGRAVVSNLVSANNDKGLVISSTPRAMSLVSVASGVIGWGGTGNLAGHVGLVVAVNEATNTATVVYTGSGEAGQPEKAWVSTYSYPASGVSFVYIGDYLK